jgi:hypothetical protein
VKTKGEAESLGRLKRGRKLYAEHTLDDVSPAGRTVETSLRKGFALFAVAEIFKAF